MMPITDFLLLLLSTFTNNANSEGTHKSLRDPKHFYSVKRILISQLLKILNWKTSSTGSEALICLVHNIIEEEFPGNFWQTSNL